MVACWRDVRVQMGWLNRRFLGLALVLITGLGSAARFAAAQDAPAASPPGSAQPAQATPAVPAPDGAPEAQAKTPLLQLGPGDSVSIQVYGQPDMSATVYVSDDGTIPVPLVGMVQVGGLSPSQASNRIEAALRNGNFLVDPHVTLTVVQSRSQRVSVLGSVGTPGRYPIESNTSIFDLLAQARIFQRLPQIGLFNMGESAAQRTFDHVVVHHCWPLFVGEYAKTRCRPTFSPQFH